MSKQSAQFYLTFSGECREAMTFYQQCLGGELSFQTIGESPMAGKLPAEMRDFILHSTLDTGRFVLLGSDMVPERGLIRGNAVSLVIHCGSEEETRGLYDVLSAGGKRDHPPEVSFWGMLTGDLTDKYGNHWMVRH